MKTYKITFKLLTPISFINIPTFDSVLSYAYVRDIKRGKGFIQKLSYDKSEQVDFSGMPIEMHPGGWFVASSMFWDHERYVEFTERWRKRWANQHDHITDFGKKMRKVRINASEFKSYDMPINVAAIEKVWFYFRTNNLPEVDRLVRNYIFFLGKKRSQGYGEIGFFNIEPSEFDFENTIYRPIPEEKIDITTMLQNSNNSMRSQYCSWRPIYWDPQNFALCFVPY